MSNAPLLRVVAGRRLACDQCRLHPICLPDHLPAAAAARIAALIQPQPPVPRGTQLFHQGAPMTAFYILRSGSAKALVGDGDGRESIMSFVFPSDLIGTASLDRTVYHDTVVTLERSSVCILPARELGALLQTDVHALAVFLDKIAERIRIERRARVRLEHASADQRLADFIVELSQRLARLRRDPHELELSMSRYDIANYIGLAAETVSRVLRRFSDSGLITVQRKQLTVHDPARLRSVAGAACRTGTG